MSAERDLAVPSEEELARLEELVEATRAATRKMQAAETEQTGAIRTATGAKAKRKAARAARRRNR